MQALAHSAGAPGRSLCAPEGRRRQSRAITPAAGSGPAGTIEGRAVHVSGGCPMHSEATVLGRVVGRGAGEGPAV